MEAKPGIFVRVMLAVVSALGVATLFHLELNVEHSPGFVTFYGVSGLFFAAGVLYPCIRQDRFLHLRTTALVVASAVSYWSAIWMATDGPLTSPPFAFPDGWEDLAVFVSASYVGAAIVVFAAAAAAPLRISAALLGYVLVAATLGGAIASVTLTKDGFPISSSGFACWHVLMALAFHLSQAGAGRRYQAIP